MKKTNYFNIGLFVLIGITLFVLAIIALNASNWFKQPFFIETYFNESISGLEVGSPVKYRGVTIGKVAKIGFAKDIYDDDASRFDKVDQYIYVKMAIAVDESHHLANHVIVKTLQQAVAHGLRVKITSQGFTGSAYLDLDYFNPKHNPSLKIDWVPEYYYIPSVASTFTQISDRIEKVFRELNTIDFTSLFTNFNALVKDTDTVAKSLPNTINLVNQTVGRTNALLSDQQQHIESTLENMAALSRNLRAVSENAKQYPSHILFGKAPPHLDPRR